MTTDEVVQTLHKGNSPVRITRKWYATQLQLKQLDDWFHDYCNSEDSVDGANRFRKFIHSKAKEEA